MAHKQAIKKETIVAESAMSEGVCVFVCVYFLLTSTDLLRFTASKLTVDNTP